MPKSSSSSSSSEPVADVDPALIRFTHSRIRPLFSDGREVRATLADILAGKTQVSDIPMLAVIMVDGEHYSMNNRRLWVFKELRARDFLQTIPVRLKPPPDGKRMSDRFTPAGCALSAKFQRK